MKRRYMTTDNNENIAKPPIPLMTVNIGDEDKTLQSYQFNDLKEACKKFHELRQISEFEGKNIDLWIAVCHKDAMDTTTVLHNFKSESHHVPAESTIEDIAKLHATGEKIPWP
jgi:hypothetical protein